MSSTISLKTEFVKGIWKENPVMASLLGLCPALAVTNAAMNGLAMGLATTFVLLSSSLMISALRNFIPHQVRIAGYIVIIATFVTVADRFLAAYLPVISASLGPYIPLIVVNCLILGRQEAFSSRNGIGRSLLDSLGMGLGFILVLVVLGIIREILGSGSIFGVAILGDWFTPWMIMILPPGAFLTLGILIALANWYNDTSRSKDGGVVS
ncbi:MAG: electron transport complex subunit E [Candidatus Marinimicrobia bacterium]|jgi:electron transport complex protein RnfE|nr:electron transport complex subunit E [Candidatus Neomarinimicrobiota bacterium]MBT3631236.1 electron transport complex subunit E [Candidatus Neomarinimicrobiota bacterium]MBT3824744.1 electron transport complex subunit E [Candidatus Neomarinimicrobiota bacterium]MBT4132022.1 electron transport complex subunit E [Candidatus Neomarinimicrobiota bacterium]MBT4296137.1 electron transport complex subunit E [Candidatus Neomarinimicrobiota bacterium]